MAMMESHAFAVVVYVMYVRGVPLKNAGRLLQTESHLLFLIEKQDLHTVDYVVPVTLRIRYLSQIGGFISNTVLFEILIRTK